MNQLCFFKFVFLSLMLGSSWSLATISPQNLGVINASGVIIPDARPANPDPNAPTSGSGNVIVYGGIMGPDCTGTTTCNNCTASNIPCNKARISSSSALRFTFKTDNAAAFAPNPSIFFLVDGNKKVSPSAASTSFAVNSELFAEIRWSDLCAEIGAGAGCINNATETIQLGISSNSDTTLNESISIVITVLGDPNPASNQYTSECFVGSAQQQKGFCWVNIKRGDEKVYIEDPLFDELFPQNTYGGTYTALRVFYAEAPGAVACDANQFPTAVTSLSDSEDFPFSLNADGKSISLDGETITGLENGKLYYFRFASVDAAGNVSHFSGDDPVVGAPNHLLNCFNHSAIPAEVTGVLDDKACFIATAAYGSSMAPEVDILRSFRDQFLKTNGVGRWLVKQYYTYSPKWARKIKKRETAKAVVRATLSPVISTAQWVILHGLKSFIMLSMVGFFLGFFIVRRFIQEHE